MPGFTNTYRRPEGKFKGKTVWVTGAETALGSAAADAFEREGARVLRSGVDGTPNPLTEEEAVDQISGIDKLDVLVTANRSIMVKPLLDTDCVEFDREIERNLTSVCCVMRAAIAKMSMERISPESISGNGAMLIISSIHGEKPNGSAGLYSMACGGLNMLAREAAQEFGRLGVRVNLIAPGPIDGEPELFPSEITALYDDAADKVPLGRLGSPEEIAKAALFLCSDDASFINGALIPCDGGFLGYYGDADVDKRVAAYAAGKEARHG
ncbi:oxidoreductase [Clostridia bacterium]|nr:oxidoreductase [Clostridia bacterium]